MHAVVAERGEKKVQKRVGWNRSVGVCRQRCHVTYLLMHCAHGDAWLLYAGLVCCRSSGWIALQEPELDSIFLTHPKKKDGSRLCGLLTCDERMSWYSCVWHRRMPRLS